MKETYQKYGTCIGVKLADIVYANKHRFVDGSLHYSASICNPCVELVRKLRVSRELTANGLEKELLKEFVGLQPVEEGGK